MSEHHKHTEFLKHCLRYEDSPEHKAMMEKLSHIQRELRIVKRALWLLGVLIAFTFGCLAYPALLTHNFPYNVQGFLMNFIVALFAGLSISLVVFVALGIILCLKLHRQREACRQLIMRLLATQLSASE